MFCLNPDGHPCRFAGELSQAPGKHWTLRRQCLLQPIQSKRTVCVCHVSNLWSCCGTIISRTRISHHKSAVFGGLAGWLDRCKVRDWFSIAMAEVFAARLHVEGWELDAFSTPWRVQFWGLHTPHLKPSATRAATRC